jgi:Ca2+-binding RTX toxin-like protein
MTTFTTTGFSRTVDYLAGTYGDFQAATLEVIRQDGQGDFVYHYNSIDETGMGPKFANIFDPWSLSMIVSPGGAHVPVDLKNGTDFVERLIFAVDWGVGKTSYVLSTFQPVEGIETIFFLGGDLPVIADLAGLNTFLARPQRYVLEGPFEGGTAIPLGGLPNTTVVEDDVVTAIADLSLYWDAGVGNDTVTGGLTNDTLIGGAGDDVMASGGGSDTLMGMTGNDSLTGTGFYTFLGGGAGDDTLVGQSDFGDQLEGGAGNDLIRMSDGQVMGETRFSHSHANGGSGQDSIEGGLAGDVAHGGQGDDVLTGYAGEDQLEGGGGNDLIIGGTDNDMLSGGLGADTLRGDNGRDTVLGGGGNDRVLGGGQNDRIEGGLAQDKLFGNAGADLVFGDAGHDLVQGDAGADSLYGGEGNDTLIGGTEADLLEGGAGADQFRFVTRADSALAAPDRIADFELGLDLIDLSRIDAVAGVTGNQAFAWIGTAAFTAEGQVRLASAGGGHQLEVNTTGASGAEMIILATDLTGIGAGDFIL